MKLTETQRFGYTLLFLFWLTIIVFVVLNFYAVDIFIVVLAIEFLLLTELTEPFNLQATWRKNIMFFIIACFMIFVILVYQRVVSVI